MSGLKDLKAGDPVIIVSDNPRRENPRRRTVKTAGPVWITTENGLKYSVTNGEEREHFGYQDRALTVPQWQDRCERRRCKVILTRWGMNPARAVPSPERTLTMEQMAQLAALLESWEK